MIGEPASIKPFFLEEFTMFETLLPFGVVTMAVVGAGLAMRGNFGPNKAELLISWAVLAIAAASLMLITRTDHFKKLQESILFERAWQSVLVGLALMAFGMFGTSRGNGADHFALEVSGVLSWITGIVLIIMSWLTPEQLQTCQNVFRAEVNNLAQGTPPGNPPPTTQQANNALPTDIPRLNLVTWTAAEPNKVKFQDPGPNRKWAIKHRKQLTPFPISGNLYEFPEPLEDVKVFEVDVSDPSKPRPATTASLLTQR